MLLLTVYLDICSCEECAIYKDVAPDCYPSGLKIRGQSIIAAFAKYKNVLVL